jgi:FkbM family methyltransferase
MTARAKLNRSVNVLQREGARRFVELSIHSLIEPIRSLRLRASIAADAKQAESRLRRGGCGRGLFIDCGSNIGQGYSYFSKYYRKEHFDYILVEPNPRCLPFLEAVRADCRNHIEIIGKAASTRSGSAMLFGPPLKEGGPTDQALSIMAEHNSSLYDSEAATADTVETFSLSQLVLEKRNSYDVIAMKMDVEGAEYDILQDFVETGAHRELFAVYVEFHSQYMKPTQRLARHFAEQRIKRSLQKENVIVREWI